MSSIDRLPKLEMLKDEEGSVILAWVGGSVVHAKFMGGLSERVGLAYVSRLAQALRGNRVITYFADASALERYDLVARSAFVRLVLAHRRQFASIVILTWPGGVSPIEQAIASAIGESVTLLTSARQFDQLLTAAAPLARQRLSPPQTGDAPVHPTRKQQAPK